MDKFQGKYRIASHRKPGWDYSTNALYFITIVTQNRDCNLGIIKDNEILLSDFGKIVNYEWHQSFEMRKEIFLDAFIIMPNHLHAIVEIKNNDEIIDNCNNPPNVHTHGPAYPQQGRAYPPHRLPKSISSFIAGFKSSVNSKIDDYIDEHHLNIPKYNRNNHFFQPNYHDHIIQNHKSHQNIANYIFNNPSKWENDTMNS